MGKQQGPTYSTGNYIQYPVINHNGKEYLKKNVYMCITESLCCTAELNTTLYIVHQLYFNFKKFKKKRN